MGTSSNKQILMTTVSNHKELYNVNIFLFCFIKERRFDFGMTYGDTTRSLAVCYDSPGYAAGDYNSTGPKFDRITIRV